MQILPLTLNKEAACRRILGQLPDWFGRPAAIDTYADHAANAVMFGAEVDGQLVGYLSLAQQFDINCEIHSMGVLPQWHRKGIGAALIAEAANWARAENFPFLSVKTLAESHPDPNYQKTRLFYQSMGFMPFEEFTHLWGADLPCLMLVRPLDP